MLWQDLGGVKAEQKDQLRHLQLRWLAEGLLVVGIRRLRYGQDIRLEDRVHMHPERVCGAMVYWMRKSEEVSNLYLPWHQ